MALGVISFPSVLPTVLCVLTFLGASGSFLYTVLVARYDRSLERDEILNKTLAVVMNYIKVEAGEIWLLEDDKETLRMVLHRGQAAEAFWTRTRIHVGEGVVGAVARSGQRRVSTDLSQESGYLRPAVIKAGFRQMAYSHFP